MSRTLLTCLLALALPAFARAETGSWTFRASYYTHDPVSGERVMQFAPKDPSIGRYVENYEQSGYRQNEFSLNVGDSADHQHVVETWGNGAWIRPYGEWKYPYRPGATPYTPWGNPQGPGMQPWGNPGYPGGNPGYPGGYPGYASPMPYATPYGPPAAGGYPPAGPFPMHPDALSPNVPYRLPAGQ